MAEFTFKERRSHKRIRFEAPATVTAEQHTLAASTKDVSIRGLFLFTDMRFNEGSKIDIMLSLPEKLGLSVSGMVCCHGRVVRVDSDGGQYGWKGFHAFRRGLATNLHELGIPAETIRLILRHSDVITTQRSYIKPTNDEVRKAMAKLETRLNETSLDQGHTATSQRLM